MGGLTNPLCVPVVEWVLVIQGAPLNCDMVVHSDLWGFVDAVCDSVELDCMTQENAQSAYLADLFLSLDMVREKVWGRNRSSGLIHSWLSEGYAWLRSWDTKLSIFGHRKLQIWCNFTKIYFREYGIGSHKMIWIKLSLIWFSALLTLDRF